MTSLKNMGITISVLATEPEARFLVTMEPVDWNTAVTLAKQ